MDNPIFNKIITFTSDHFELMIYVSGYLILIIVLVAVAVKLRDYSLRKFLLSTVQGILFTGIIGGQIMLFVILGYLYWKNYEKPAPQLHLTKDMSATTHWVKDDVTIYFIDENTLRSIKINGKDSDEVFKSDSPIKQYHFSPNGKYIIIVTQMDLTLVNRKTLKNRLIDTLKHPDAYQQSGDENTIQGSISGIQWSPDSDRFCYEIARWSKFGSQDNIFIYSINDETKRSIKSPMRRISSVYWGDKGENLYYLRHEARDPSLNSSAFEIKIFRIPLITLTPELIAQIPFENMSVPFENLKIRGINLFLGGSKLSFSLTHQKDHLISENGSSIGLDDDDYLYFTNSKWFRRRLFKIPREAAIGDVARYQYKGGDLIIDHIRWIPGGRYVIMDHKYWGVLILEPSTGRFGVLIEASGRAFGWYE